MSTVLPANRRPISPDDLPKVRGKLETGVLASSLTWLKVGGPMTLFHPRDLEDLQNFLSRLPLEVPVTFLGGGANVLIRDRGIPGVVIQLTEGFRSAVRDEETMECGAGLHNARLATLAKNGGLGGFSFLSGIPGTLGGCVRMNAGAYGVEFSQVLDWVEIVTRKGELQSLPVEDLRLSYRASRLPAGACVVRMRLLGKPESPEAIREQMVEISRKRKETQPRGVATGGSIFKNPKDKKAWQLITEAGCKDLDCGQAALSPLHSNFFLNKGEASADDFETLGEVIRETVLAESGVQLLWEIRRLGEAP